MSAPADAILQQMDALLDRVRTFKARSKYDDIADVPDDELVQVRTRLAAAIERFAPRGSEYREALSRANEHWGTAHNYAVVDLSGVLAGLRGDYADGYLASVQELIHADVFADMLDMASELQEKGYKDPAAVIAGSVLEEHLRKLAVKHGLAVTKAGGEPKKADALNAELAEARPYNKLVQKSVTAWLDLRNKAAHGQYDEYDHPQVAALIRDVRDFAARHPA